jgi:hypothetical protein
MRKNNDAPMTFPAFEDTLSNLADEAVRGRH